MKDEDFYDLLDEVNAMSSEEYNEYHEQALSVKEGAEMTEESMFCDENGKQLPRKNKFDMALYEAKVGTKEDDELTEAVIKELADKQFCDYKGLLCLGYTDEGYLPYDYDEYLSFVEGFKRAFKIRS